MRKSVMLAGAGLAGLAAGLLVAMLVTPVYRAEVKLLPVSTNQGLGLADGGLAGLEGLGGLLGGALNSSSATKSSALEILKSRRLLRDFIAENNLLPVLYPAKWNGSENRWRVSEEDVPSLSDAARLFDRRIRRVTEDRRTGIVTLAIEWRNPQQAADWANRLIERLNGVMRARASRDAERNLAYLNRQLEKTSVIEIREAIYRLIEQEIKAAMLADVRVEFAVQVVDPAFPPPKREFVWPNRPLLIAGGLALGLIVGLAIVGLPIIRRVVVGRVAAPGTP